MNSIKLDDGTTITQIGTLEWNIEDGDILPTVLSSIRPTIEKDTDKVRIAAAVYKLDMGEMQNSFKDRIEETMIYVAHHNLKVLYDEGIVKGKVLLVFAAHTLDWWVKIACNVYMDGIKLK